MSRGVSKVEVLCPNGHRVGVNVTHGTRLLQVREECCLKQRLGSPELYILKHNRRELDLALPVNQLGLSNMAKLDLVKTEAGREDAKVRIGLEVANVEGRLQREFDPTTSLWGVVESFEKDDGRGGRLNVSNNRVENDSPVMVYVNEEIVGDYALQSTTLKMLGIFRGSHLLKLSFKIVSSNKLFEVEQKIDYERERISRLAARAAATAAAEEARSMPQDARPSPQEAQPSPHEARPNPRRDPGCVSSVVTERPGVPKGRSEEPMDLSHEVVSASGASDVRGEGMVENPAPGVVLPFVPQSSSSTFLGRQEDPWFFPEHSPRLQIQSPFATFKFPEETKGKDIYRNEFSDVNRNDFLPCDRETVLFSLDEPETGTIYDDNIGDDFFEHTVSDLKVLQASLSREVSSIDDQPLMTRAMRNAQRTAKMSCYDRFIVRFEFPDRLVLQAVFRPAETVSALYKFVKETLAEKDLNFELYTTPPRIVLEDRTETLIEAGLGPLALIHFKAKGHIDESRETGFLSADVLNSMSCRGNAKEVLSRHLPARKTGGTHDGLQRWGENVAGPSTQGTPSTQGQSMGNSAASKASNKVPKWFHQGTK